MNAIQTQYIKAQYTVDTLKAVVEGKLSRINLNGLEGREYRKAKREASYNLASEFGLLTAQKELLNAENSLIEWGIQLSGVELEKECILNPEYRDRIIHETLRVNA